MEDPLPKSNRKKRLFVFDIDRSFHDALSLCFSEKYEIHAFDSLDSSKHKKLMPDLILLDVFPLIRTQELLSLVSAVRKLYQSIPIVLISTSKHALQKAKKIGMHDLLEKPFELEALQSKLASL